MLSVLVRWGLHALCASTFSASLALAEPLPPAPAAAAAAAEPAPAPYSLDDLRRDLASHVSQPHLAGALFAVHVVSLETGDVLFSHDAERRMSPASNCKLYVGAWALDSLGGDYRIDTPLLATSAPEKTGVLRGHLVVRGTGDPSWRSADRSPEGFLRLLDPLVNAVASAGVTRIEGDVIADATALRLPLHGAGWTVDDLNHDYGAEVSSLTLESNYADLRASPAAAVGEPCVLELVQPHTGLHVVNRTATLPPDARARLEVRRQPGEAAVHVWGGVPLGAKPEITDVSVPRPAAWVAAALRDALVRHGIRVSGRARSIRWPEEPVGLEKAVSLARIASPPLRQLVKDFMKPSQNLETNLVFAHLGERSRTAETSAWTTSEELAVEGLAAFLARCGIDAGDVRFEDGSGLSRNNLATARATVRLLQFMDSHAEAEAFRDSLPVAGVDGTLRTRMRGTPAEGRVLAKTGTLRWASSLSGYVTTAAGERLAFSAMLNRSVQPSGRPARAEVEEIAVRLAALAVPARQMLHPEPGQRPAPPVGAGGDRAGSAPPRPLALSHP
jgi:serine-type D-Ala-D-Ala carboxypeptidase/endopeptidase (penicillin-binding protein 4)